VTTLHGAVSGAPAQPAGSLHRDAFLRQACTQAQRCAGHAAVHARTGCLQPPHAQAGDPWRLLFSRGYRAELLVASCVAFFSQINGARAMASSSSVPSREAAGGPCGRTLLVQCAGPCPPARCCASPCSHAGFKLFDVAGHCASGAQGSTPYCSTAPSSSPRWAPASRRRCSLPWLCAPNAGMGLSCIVPVQCARSGGCPGCCRTIRGSASTEHFQRACCRQACRETDSRVHARSGVAAMLTMHAHRRCV